MAIKTMADIAEPLNGIVDGPFGSNLKKADYIDDCENGIPVLTTKNLHGDYSKDSVRYVSKEKYEALKRSTVYPGDILVAKIGSIGVCGIYPLSCERALIPANLLKITVLPTVDRKYVYYYIKSRGFQERIKAISTATAQPAFNVTKFRKLPIPVPSLDNQKRIVARIEELFSQLDSGVETLRKTKQQLVVYRQAVLKEAFSGFSDYTTLASLSTRIFDGPFGTNLKTADYVSSGIRVVRLENIKNGWFDDSKQSFVTEAKYESIKQHTVYPSDLIMSTFMADSIKICQLPAHIPFAVNKADCIGIRLRDNYLPKFVMYYLLQREVYQRVAVDIHGATRPRVNTKQIKAIPIPKAGFELQNAIVSSVEEKLSLCDSIENTVDMSLHQAEAMRQSILKQAFESQL